MCVSYTRWVHGLRIRSAALDFAGWAPAAGLLLLIASILAVALSNSTAGADFLAFWETGFALIFGDAAFRMSLLHCAVCAGQWMGSPDVRLALTHNATPPPAYDLRILPTLPDSEVRANVRAGTSMALETAALRPLQGKLI